MMWHVLSKHSSTRRPVQVVRFMLSVCYIVNTLNDCEICKKSELELACSTAAVYERQFRLTERRQTSNRLPLMSGSSCRIRWIHASSGWIRKFVLFSCFLFNFVDVMVKFFCTFKHLKARSRKNRGVFKAKSRE